MRTTLALLALLAVADADRSLLAHKPSGGSSNHVVTFNFGYRAAGYTYPKGYTGNTSALPNVYVSSNGNGSWAPLLGGSINYQLNSVMYAAGALQTPTTGTVVTGVYGLAFPSMKLGIAVAAGSGAGTTAVPVWPNILTTVDEGLTWQLVTGFSGTPAGFTANTYPDLTSISCSSTKNCIAVGGYFPNLAAFANVYGGVSYYGTWTGTQVAPNTGNGVSYFTNASFPAAAICTSASSTFTPGCGSFQNTAGLLPTYGAVLRSTNGGTQWSFVPVGVISGLTAVASDASGAHVYAVGATAGITNTSAMATGPSLAVGYYSAPPTIIYSGNYGASWVNQSAPVIPQAYYQLNTVAVLRGTIAFAAGGNPFAHNGIGALSSFAFGTIVATFNGGFTWSQQPIASYGTSASASTTQAVNSPGGLIPVINSIAFVTPKTGSQAGKYVGWAVGENGLILTQASGVPIHTLSNVQPSQQLYFPWTTPAGYPAALLYPAGNAVTTFPNIQSLYSVVWDNNAVGYIMGQGVILSTHTAGATWQVETPAIVTATGALLGWPAAVLPTTF